MANRYWVGGTGNWDASTTTNWSASSGGAGGASVPTASDNVIFDTLSNATAYTVTITATANCLDFTMGAPLSGKVTWAGTSSLAISGSLNLSGGTAGITRTYTGQITFIATSGTKTIDVNSVAMSSEWIFNGSGGTFQLASDLVTGPGVNGNFTLTAGTFDPNGKTVTINSAGGLAKITGAFTFYNLSWSGVAGKLCRLSVASDIVVTHTLSINGNSVINRGLIDSSVIGTQKTITITGTTGNSYSNVDFKDINLYDAAGTVDLSAITGLSGNCGGNSGITFTNPVTTNWQSGATWSTATWSSRVPLPQDIATFTTAGVATITQDMPRIGTVSFAGSANKTWTTSTSCSCFGSINLTDLVALTASTQTYTFEGRGNYYLTSAGFTWAKKIVMSEVLGTLILQDDFITTVSGVGLTMTAGTFNTNGKNVTMETCSSASVTGVAKAMVINNTLWTLTGTGTVWSFNASDSFSGTGSTIKITDSSNTAITFAGTDYSYGTLWFSRGASTGSNTITGSNIFTQLKDTGTEAHSLLFTAGTTQTIASGGWNVRGTSGKEITINSTTTGIFTLVATGGGIMRGDYLNIQHSVATPALTWYAGAYSTDNQAVATAGSGWIFTMAPSENAKRDENRITSIMGTSSYDGVTPINIYSDPVTHALLISS